MSILDADFGGRRARRKFVRWLIFIAVVLACFWLLPGLLYLYTEWLWFKHDVRYPAVFLTILQTKIGLGAVFGLAFVALVLLNASIARRLARRSGWYQEETALRQQIAEVMEYFSSRYLYLALLLFALVIGYGVATGAAAQWDKYLQFRNATSFGVKDPVFGRDVGFYVFRLPFWQYLWQWSYIALIAVFIITAAVHYLDKAIRMLRGVPSLASHVKTHLSILLALILVVKAFGYRLEAYGLLYSAHDAFFGAGYTDVNAQLLACNVLFAVALVAAALTLFSMFSRGIWVPLAGLAFLAAISLLLGSIYPAVVQRFQVQPAEFEREQKFIARNIEFTRRGFGLDDMRTTSMASVTLLGPAQVKRNLPTLENVRLWDYRPLLDTYQQQQSLTQYYRFDSVDIDRYTIEGRYRQVMLAARELIPPAEAGAWQAQHVIWTHGYGIAMSPVTDAVGSGLPNYMIQDIPPKSPVGLKVTRPGIYYGERTGDYVLTGTTTEENDYPLTAANKIAKTRYSGKGGVPLSSSLARLAAAVRFGEMNLLISTLLTDKSRILWEREISSRVRRLAPFLSYDGDPYIVLGEDGHLYWILDAYTTSTMFPYSKPYKAEEGGRMNYLRNAVKVVVEAYDGTVDFYVADTEDPIVRTYQRIFPGLFRDLAALPAGLSAHLRYPEGLFNAQGSMLITYHVTDPQAFYSGSERWEEAREAAKSVGAVEVAAQDGSEAMQAYYTIISLPNRKQPEFLLMLPFTPRDKQNMVAWFAGQCDADAYGQKLLYEFPKTEQVWGPMQIEAAINQNADFSQTKTLLNQQGSKFFPGNLLVLPMDNSILYVEPYYLSASTRPIPELKYVVVARGDGRIAFGTTFSEALTQLLGQAPPSTIAEEPTGLQAALALPPADGAAPPPAAVPMPPDVRGLVQRAQREYNEALDQQRKGDWAGYGESLKKLQKTLDELDKKTGR
jgi:uncharacterized membrane protein (UPF0182 family)